MGTKKRDTELPSSAPPTVCSNPIYSTWLCFNEYLRLFIDSSPLHHPHHCLIQAPEGKKKKFKNGVFVFIKSLDSLVSGTMPGHSIYSMSVCSLI